MKLSGKLGGKSTGESVDKSSSKLIGKSGKKLAGKKIGKVKYPEKTSLNLLIQEKSTIADPKVQIILFVIFIILLLVFVKFMVVDKIAAAYSAQSQYETIEADIAELQSLNSEYDKVREEYSHYGNGYLNEREKAEVDRMYMIDLINSKVMIDADMQSMEISGNVAVITIDNVSLKTVSSIVASLEETDSVSYVSVSTAGTGEESSSKVTATLTIKFKATGGEQQ